MIPTHEQAVTLARQGQLDRALEMLQQLHAVNPQDAAILYDYAICMSELGRKADAIPLLHHLLEMAPNHVNGVVALGVALAAEGQVPEAKQAFRKALEIEPGNVYAMRSLGALAASAGYDAEAERLLRETLKVAPDDFYGRINLAKLLELSDDAEAKAESDRLYKGILTEDPVHAVAEEARKGRTRLAAVTVRSKAVGNLRMDVVFYMIDAINRFKDVNASVIGEIAMEIAVLGRTGLDTNNPDKRYEIKLLQGENFSGLELVSIMHVGVRQFDKTADTGTGLDLEYNTAVAMTQGH
jgi:tetratricopeptide (TPR) repeat protein